MKKVILLVIALIAGCIILLMVYKQRQSAELSEEMTSIPQEIMDEIGDAREDVAHAMAQEREEVVEGKMQQIENDYEKETSEPMPAEIAESVRTELSESADEKE